MIPKIHHQNRTVKNWLNNHADRLRRSRHDPDLHNKAQAWSQLIGQIEATLPAEHKIVLNISRQHRYYGQFPNALGAYLDATGKPISKWKFIRILNEVVEMTAREALERKLL